MAQPYNALVGPPPDPRTFAFLDWADRLVAARIAYCDQPRAATYYFAQAGNDATGNGTQGNPWKTKAKAQAVVSASSGSVALLFRCGDVWTEQSTLSDNGLPNVTFGAWGQVGPTGVAKPAFDGAGADLDGLEIYGDGSVVQGVLCRNWGQSTTAQKYPIKLAQWGAAAGLVIDCEAYNGGKHVVSHFARNYGGGTGAGGIAAVVACRAGGTVDAGGTTYNFYSDAGGHEYVVADCDVTALPAYGVGCYCHTGSAGTIALGLVVRLRLLSGCAASAVGAANTPNAATIRDARLFEIDTVQELPPAGVFNGVNVTGLSNGVRVNGFYAIAPDPTNSSREVGHATVNSWCLNTTYLIDLLGATTSGYLGLVNHGDGGYGLYHWLNCRLHWRNVAAGPVAFEFACTFGNDYGSQAGSDSRNSIYSSENSGGNVRIGTGDPSRMTLANNAYFGMVDDGIQYEGDAVRIPLDVLPPLGASPHAGSPLYQASAPPADGVPLEYDARRQPRNFAGQHVGPIETVTRNQLIAGQLAMLRVDADLVTALAGNAVAVDHDTGGPDALRYVAPDGSGIDAAAVRAYLQADYAAGRYVVRARAATGPDGRWLAPMYLPADQTYTLLFEKPGDYGPDVRTVTV